MNASQGTLEVEQTLAVTTLAHQQANRQQAQTADNQSIGYTNLHGLVEFVIKTIMKSYLRTYRFYYY